MPIWRGRWGSNNPKSKRKPRESRISWCVAWMHCKPRKLNYSQAPNRRNREGESCDASSGTHLPHCTFPSSQDSYRLKPKSEGLSMRRKSWRQNYNRVLLTFQGSIVKGTNSLDLTLKLPGSNTKKRLLCARLRWKDVQVVILKSSNNR